MNYGASHGGAVPPPGYMFVDGSSMFSPSSFQSFPPSYQMVAPFPGYVQPPGAFIPPPLLQPAAAPGQHPVFTQPEPPKFSYPSFGHFPSSFASQPLSSLAYPVAPDAFTPTVPLPEPVVYPSSQCQPSVSPPQPLTGAVPPREKRTAIASLTHEHPLKKSRMAPASLSSAPHVSTAKTSSFVPMRAPMLPLCPLKAPSMDDDDPKVLASLDPLTTTAAAAPSPSLPSPSLSKAPLDAPQSLKTENPKTSLVNRNSTSNTDNQTTVAQPITPPPTAPSDHSLETQNVYPVARAEEQWLRRLSELEDFQNEYGHTNVPRIYPSNQSLAEWVRTQRRAHRALKLIPSRYNKLEILGFRWRGRQKNAGKPPIHPVLLPEIPSTIPPIRSSKRAMRDDTSDDDDDDDDDIDDDENDDIDEADCLDDGLASMRRSTRRKPSRLSLSCAMDSEMDSDEEDNCSHTDFAATSHYQMASEGDTHGETELKNTNEEAQRQQKLSSEDEAQRRRFVDEADDVDIV